MFGNLKKTERRAALQVLGLAVFAISGFLATDNLQKINSTYKNPYIVAIDACLGSSKNVGNFKLYITIYCSSDWNCWK